MVTAVMRKKKLDYYYIKFTDLKNNLRATWNLINEVIKPNCQRTASERENLGDSLRTI